MLDGMDDRHDVTSGHESADRVINAALPPTSSEQLIGGQPFNLAIACMTKRPQNFITWLTYHYEVAGVQHFFLRVEDTPTLEHFLTQPPWNARCTTTFAHSTVRDWSGQTGRQMTHVQRSIRKATEAGYTHLLHLDDDELLFLPNGTAALHSAVARAPVDVADLHALTLEALAPSIDTQNPFAECVAFKHRPQDYCAYGGGPNSKGKSIGSLSSPHLWPRGPHHFSRSNGEDSSETLVLPPPVAVILHYESCRYQRWRDKVSAHGRPPRLTFEPVESFIHLPSSRL